MIEDKGLQEAKLEHLEGFKQPENGNSFYYLTKDNTRLRVCIWNSESEKGTIVLQSGRGEFIEKYFEVVSDFINQGYCVAMFDWRGQGLSDRLTDNYYLGYVHDFKDYENDLLEICNEIYKDLPRPWIGMGHSMGGCLIALSCSNNPTLFDKVILCAPMLSLKVPKTLKNLALLIGNLSFIGFRKKAFPSIGSGQTEGWEQVDFKDNVVTSDKERYLRSTSLIYKNKKLAIGPVSIAWLHEAIRNTDLMKKNNWAKKITAPLLLLNATKDKLVDPEVNKEICLEMNNSVIVDIESEHEILMEKDSIREKAFKEIKKFIDS